MNILVLPSWYKTEMHPTLGSFFTEQAIGLVKRGHQVDVLFCHMIKPEEVLLQKRTFTYLDHSVTTHLIYDRVIIPKTATIQQVIRAVSYGIKLCKNKKIDVIHAHSTLGGYIAYWISKFTNIPYVYTEHSTNYSRGLMVRREKRMTLTALSRASKIIAVSEGLKAHMLKITSSKIDVIPNMVAEAFFKRDTYQSCESKKFTFFSCAYLTYKKGFDNLIEACKVLKEHGLEFELLIGGDGEERDNLQHLINLNTLTDVVKLLGPLTRDQVARNMEECDCFVLASRHETFGIVYVEALAKGKPIIMTKTDAYQDIVKRSNGIAVDIEQINQLADAMMYMIHHIDEFDGEEISKDCHHKFSETSILSQYESVYQQATRGEHV